MTDIQVEQGFDIQVLANDVGGISLSNHVNLGGGVPLSVPAISGFPTDPDSVIPDSLQDNESGSLSAMFSGTGSSPAFHAFVFAPSSSSGYVRVYTPTIGSLRTHDGKPVAVTYGSGLTGDTAALYTDFVITGFNASDPTSAGSYAFTVGCYVNIDYSTGLYYAHFAKTTENAYKHSWFKFPVCAVTTAGLLTQLTEGCVVLPKPDLTCFALYVNTSDGTLGIRPGKIRYGGRILNLSNNNISVSSFFTGYVFITVRLSSTNITCSFGTGSTLPDDTDLSNVIVPLYQFVNGVMVRDFRNAPQLGIYE